MERLLAEGFFHDRDAALPYLMSGAVLCGGAPVRTGGQRISAELPLVVRGLWDRYVGKGGYKLEGALSDFQADARGRICIDAGACTGGFTDCLLQHGASLVYAVEVGFGQLAGSLRQDARVVNLEKTNLGDEALLALSPTPTLGSVDLSYLSLEKAVPLYRAIMRGTGELLCLVKPLFETDDATARRTGQLDESTYAPLLRALCARLNAQPDTAVAGVTHSHVTGNNGTREFFLHVKFGNENAPLAGEALEMQIEKAVDAALELTRFKAQPGTRPEPPPESAR